MKTQDHINNSNTANISAEVKLYTKRWFVLAALVLLVFLTVLNVYVHGVLNNLLVAYFNTTYKVSDLLNIGPSVGSIVTTPFLAWLSLKELITCRKLMIIASLALAVNYICSILAFNNPSLFGLLIFGQITGGIGLAIVFVLPSALAQLWFPENQIGIALGLIMIGSSGIVIVAYEILPFIVQTPPQLNVSSNATEESHNNSWQHQDKVVYETLYAILLVVVAGILVFLLFFVPEKPEKPPSYAQYLKRTDSRSNAAKNLNFLLFVEETKKLWMIDGVFLSFAVLTGVLYNLANLDSIVLEEVVRNTSFLPTSTLSPSAIAGFIMTCYGIGTAIGNVISGKILDKFKQYYIQSIIGTTGLTIAMIGASLSIIYKVASTCFISYIFVGMFSRICLIAVMDAIMQHTYPKNELFVTSWVVFFQNICALVIVELGRVVFEAFHTVGVMSFLCALSFLTIIVTISFKTNTKRLVVERRMNNEDLNEETPLNPQMQE